MREQTGFEELRLRAGTSQQHRSLPALNPAAAPVDERSIYDLIRFAQEYSKELLYFNEHNQAAGDWSAFLAGPNGEDPQTVAREMAAFFQDPSIFAGDPAKRAHYSRPHLVLFLTFLQLLQSAREEMNTLTQRHLDYFYQQALGLTLKEPVPDQVHVIAQVIPQAREVLIPRGTLLQAGKDSNGTAMFYETKEELLANRAQVGQVMNVFVQKNQKGLIQIRDEQRSEPDGGFMDMLKLVYGDNGLKTMHLPSFQDGQAERREMNLELVEGIDTLLSFITETLNLRLPGFRYVVQRYRDWYNNDNWEGINAHLAGSYRKRNGDTITFTDPRNFDTNFTQAIGFHPVNEPQRFDGLAEVDSVYDLYRVLIRSKEENDTERIEELTTFILDPTVDHGRQLALSFPSVDAFKSMMEIRMAGIQALRDILDLLREAVRGAGHLDLEAAVGVFDYFSGEHQLQAYIRILLKQEDPALPAFQSTTLPWVEYFDQLLAEIGTYFSMGLSQYHFMRRVFLAEQAPGPDGVVSNQPDWKWDRVFDLLTDAFQSLSAFQSLTSPVTFHSSASPSSPEPQPLPEPVETTWKNLYFAPDATAVTLPVVQRGAVPRWKTFGQAAADGGIQPGRIGFAIASPVLQLTEGFRTLTLTLGFASSGFAENLTELQKVLDNKVGKPEFPLRFWVSTAKKMVPVSVNSLARVKTGEVTLDSSTSRFSYSSAIQIVLKLGQDFPPLEALQGADAVSAWPVLEIQLADIPEGVTTGGNIQTTKQYELLSQLFLVHLHLAVRVRKLVNLNLQNDDGTLKPKKPFEPFGADPSAGNSLYVSHPDLARQRLDRVQFNLEWMNLPDMDLGAYYQAYRKLAPTAGLNVPIQSNADFKVGLSLQDGHRQYSLANEETLFPAASGEDQNNIVHSFAADDFASAKSYLRKPDTAVQGAVLDWDRYFQIELSGPGFQQDKYATLLNKQAYFAINGKYGEFTLNGAVMINPDNSTVTVFNLDPVPIPGLKAENFIIVQPDDGTISVKAYDPKAQQLILNGAATTVTLGYRYNRYQNILYPPLVPKLKRITVDFDTHMELQLQADRSQEEDQLIHLMVAGYDYLEQEHLWEQARAAQSAQNQGAATTDVPDSGGVPFLPQYKEEGTLYIGIRDLQPPQTLSLLFQLAEGSSNPSLSAASVQWHYLSGSVWKALGDGQRLSDTTGGLLTSGIIRFAIPADAGLAHTQLPADQIWLRATVDKGSGSLCDTLSIQAQALPASFLDQHNAPDHYHQPLPARTIKTPQTPIPGLAGLTQPYPSFGGRPPEQVATFYTRLSERLRHKQRALTMWDYERLVLERYPQIAKAKVIPTDLQEDPNEIGVVEMVLIPNILGKQLFDPFEPRVPLDLLREIQTWLQTLMPAFAEIRVKNPTFYYIVVKTRVRFFDMTNPNYYLRQLNLDLRNFLSPWIQDPSVEIMFGGEIYESMVVNFMEHLPYVDFIENPHLILRRRNAEGAIVTVRQPGTYVGRADPLTVDRPDVVLAASPDDHRLTLIPLSEDTRDVEQRYGIGALEVELDFQVEHAGIGTLEIEFDFQIET